MQYSADLLVMHVHDADVRRAEVELDRRRQAAERATAPGAATEASARHRRHSARAPRLALR